LQFLGSRIPGPRDPGRFFAILNPGIEKNGPGVEILTYEDRFTGLVDLTVLTSVEDSPTKLSLRRIDSTAKNDSTVLASIGAIRVLLVSRPRAIQQFDGYTFHVANGLKELHEFLCHSELSL